MKVIYLSSDTKLSSPCVATIGFFDGVHQGHQHVLTQVVKQARKEQLLSVAITFDVHPRTIMQPSFVPQLITPLSKKIELLAQRGLDVVIVIPFNAEIAHLTAFDFMQNVLKNQLNVRYLLIGHDNKFGRNRCEGFTEYTKYGEDLGIKVEQCSVLETSVGRASSSVIRSFLLNGEAEKASLLLNRPYSLEGVVVHGFQEGRKLGYPTANIKVEDDTILIPQRGVYAVKVRLLKNNKVHNGMLSIGNRPTYGEFQQTIEVNIFDFSEDIYNERVEVLFFKRMRSEVKFNGLEELKKALYNDERTIRAFFEQRDKK